jgi:hypothetical protein
MVIPTPPGFVNAGQDAPITPSGFNVFMESADGATNTSYVDGYDQTYESSSSEDTMEVAVLEFASPAAAVEFSHEVVDDWGVSVTPDQTISHAQDFDEPGRPGDPDDHGVIIVAGARAAVIDYYNSTMVRPPILATLASAQAALI